MNTIATLRSPASNAAHNRSRRCASSKGCTTSPCAPMRSIASMTRLYSNSGSSMCRSNSRGRSWYAMRNASRNPRVVTSRVGSPLRSSKALVATVVPIFTHSTWSGVIGCVGARPRRRRIPATAASRYCSGWSDNSLWVTKVPSGRRPTMSVNVPPRSIQNCHLSVEVIDFFDIFVFAKC